MKKQKKIGRCITNLIVGKKCGNNETIVTTFIFEQGIKRKKL